MSAHPITTRIPAGLAEGFGFNVEATATKVYGATYVARRAQSYDVTITIDGARRLLSSVILLAMVRDEGHGKEQIRLARAAEKYRPKLARLIVNAEERHREAVAALCTCGAWPEGGIPHRGTCPKAAEEAS